MLSYANIASTKRKGDQPASKKVAVFRPSREYIKSIEQNVLIKGFGHTRQKSQFLHGIRIIYGDIDQMLYLEVAHAANETFKNHTQAHSVLKKGFFDLAFTTKLEADEAAKKVLKVNNKLFPVLRTRYAGDGCLFIGFDKLPCIYNRAQTQELILEGIKSYGEVQDFELQTDPLFPMSGTSKGFAIIKPYLDSKEAWDKIPRKAYFLKNDIKSTTFNVFPEKVTPQCHTCQAIGHVASSCPDQLTKLKSAINDPLEMEEIDGDNFLDWNQESSKDAETFEWGEEADYARIEPLSNSQKKEMIEIKKEMVKIDQMDETEIIEEEMIGEIIIEKPILPVPKVLPPSELIEEYKFEKVSKNKSNQRQKINLNNKNILGGSEGQAERPQRAAKTAALQKNKEVLTSRPKAPNGSGSIQTRNKNEYEMIYHKNRFEHYDENDGMADSIYKKGEEMYFEPTTEIFEDENRSQHQGVSGVQC